MESKVKDIVFCFTTSHNKSSTSIIAMIHSVIIADVTLAIKGNKEFKGYNRQNNKAKDFIYS